MFENQISEISTMAIRGTGGAQGDTVIYQGTTLLLAYCFMINIYNPSLNRIKISPLLFQKTHLQPTNVQATPSVNLQCSFTPLTIIINHVKEETPLTSRPEALGSVSSEVHNSETETILFYDLSNCLFDSDPEDKE